MDEITEIKSRIDIVEFISQYLELKKAGINYSANCPFHNEKTPSFMVSPERQSFKCFGCSEGGDVISFFQKIEALTFPEALKILGERVGVKIESHKNEPKSDKLDKEKVFEINLLCAKYFKVMLGKPQGQKALNYLKKRGLSQKTLDKLKIGFAPADKGLEQVLTSRKYNFQDLSLAGHPERFRHRIMFPIFDNFSLVTGFSGRILEEGLPQGISPHPKYLNTPETLVFHKSKAIYGINFAKEAIRKQNRVVIVEGQMDVAAAHEAGIEEVVASSGTALTEEHLKILSRLTQNVIFCFDEDEAGQKAAVSAVELALELGLEPKLTTIKGYKDLGEIIEKNPKHLKEVLDKALPPVEWLFEKYQASGGQLSVQSKKEFGKKALNFIRRFQDEIERAHYVSYLARKLSVPEVTIEKILAGTRASKRIRDEVEKPKSKDSAEDLFMSFLLNFPDKIKKISFSDIKFENLEYSTIYKKFLSWYNSKELKKEKLDQSDLSREQVMRLDAVGLVWDKKISENDEAALSEFLSIKSRLEAERKEVVKTDFAKRIAEAEKAGDLAEVKKLMKSLQAEFKNN